MSGHFRLRPRFPLKVRVSVRQQQERSSREVQGETENLGFGGAFVLVDLPLPPDTGVIVSIASATTWDPLRISGRVRWVRDSRPGVPGGMAVAFEQLNGEQALALHRLFGAFGFDED